MGLRYWAVEKFLNISQKTHHMNPKFIFISALTGADKGNFNNIIIAYKRIADIESWSSSVLGDH